MRLSSTHAGARLDRLPISRFHRRILGLIGAGAFLDACDVYLAGAVMAAMASQGFSDLRTNAMFVSGTFAGMLLGAALAGWAGDSLGRRYSYQTNLAIFGLASLAAVLAPNIHVLIGLRFVMGLGLGAEVVVAAGTLCEFVPPSHRGRWASLLGLIINSGLTVATAVGYLIIPSFGWRCMFAIVGLGSIAVWCLRKRMPESPRWLESVGRRSEAERTLRAIESEVATEKGPLPPIEYNPSPPAAVASFWRLFSRHLIGRTLVACLGFVVVNTMVNGFVSWLPVFLVKQGLPIVRSLGYTSLMSFGAPTGGLVGFMIADRVPRRWSILISCLAVIGCAFTYLRMDEASAVVVTGYCLITSIYTLVVLVSYGYIPELFPTSLRLRGTGVASTCGRAASIAMPYVTISLFAAYGLYGVLASQMALLSVFAAVVVLLTVETGGCSLEQLQMNALESEHSSDHGSNFVR